MINPHQPPLPYKKHRGRKAKEIDPEDRKAVIKLAVHYKPRAIAKRVHLSRKIVQRVLEAEGLYHPVKNSQSKLSAFLQPITERVEKGLKGPRILREIQEMGYQGGRTILGDLVRHLRSQLPLAARKKIRCRFETRAALEMQCDWSLYTIPIGSRPTKIHVLGLILANSRKVHYGVYRNEKQETLLEGLARGFEYFQGCAFNLIFDNMATAVLGRIGPDRQPIWHPRLLEFARYYGFSPVACAVRDPDRKGKKEKSFRYFEDDFIKGSSFATWEELERRLHEWLDHTPGVGNCRKHGTTGLVPNEAWLSERKLLVALPERRFAVGREVIRIIDTDCTVAVAGCRYSVPAILAGHHVPVRLYAEHFEVLDSHGRLLFSRKYIDRSTHPGTLVIDSTHYANLPRRPRDQVDGGRFDQDFLKRFSILAPLVEGLKTRMKAIAPIHLRKLLRLSDLYGSEAFLKAAIQAQNHKRFDAYAVQRILERDCPLPQEDVVAPMNGSGPAILGEVEDPTFDDFAYLDDALDTDKEDNDGSQ